MRLIFAILLLFFFANSYSQKVKKYWPNGNIKVKGAMVNGVRKGVWKSYYESGELEQLGKFVYHKGSNYQDGEMITYFKNGKVNYKHVYNFIDRIEERTEWDSLGTKISYAKSVVRNSTDDNDFELEYVLYNNGKDQSDHFLIRSIGIEVSYVSYYKNGDTNEVLPLKPVDTLLKLSWKNELLNSYTPGSFSFDALQNFYQSLLTDKKKVLMYEGVWRKRTEEGKPLDEIVYKEGKKYDQLTKIYMADTLAYSRYLFEKDTFYIYPARQEINYRIIDKFDVRNSIENIGDIKLPLLLPLNYPEGRWLVLIPLKISDYDYLIDKTKAEAFLKLYNHSNYWGIKKIDNGFNYLVGQCAMYKEGKIEGDKYFLQGQTLSELDLKLICKEYGLKGDFKDSIFNSPSIIVKGRLYFGRVQGLIHFQSGNPMYLSGYGGCKELKSYHELNDSTFHGKYWIKAGGENNFGFTGGYITRGEYVNGKREGLEQIYHRNNILVGEKKWLHNQILYEKHFDETGSLIQEIIYDGGILKKLKEREYENGKLVMESFYKNGIFYKTIYYKDGKAIKVENAPIFEQ